MTSSIFTSTLLKTAQPAAVVVVRVVVVVVGNAP
ncbi:ilvB operon leader peptide IvbL [Enterobacter cloacae]|nr:MULTISPECIES: ilvB operon leader peptide IvbL [Enterobacter]MCK6861411.1 ilvB operon leader peptide IvbL [Enterobacter bugandensis]RAY85159.1 ilvB operon leader peptide IvbL [Enterobacter cloacae]HBC7434424.1 ilvB operon leader peptide IvbL [Enterobacter bugandensis]